MDKRTFNNISYMIYKECRRNDLTELCEENGITVDEFDEFDTDLALRGFEYKYNQHNHPENNPNATN